jgi:hypothetical protein
MSHRSVVGLRGFQLVFLAVYIVAIIDLERPTAGGTQESQAPMELLRDSLKNLSAEISARDEVR